MAKNRDTKSTAPQRKTQQQTAQPPGRNWFSENRRWVFGFVLLSAALLMMLSVVSYFISWRFDQDKVRWGMEWLRGAQSANWCGNLGALVADLFVGQWFGVFGAAIPILTGIIAVRIVRHRSLALRKAMWITIFTMILGSLSLGLAFGTQWDIFGSGLGGEHGIWISEWIVTILGRAGAAVALFSCWVLLCVYINRSTIRVVNRVGEAIGSVAAGVAGHESSAEEPDEDNDGSEEEPEDEDEEEDPFVREGDMPEPPVVQPEAEQPAEPLPAPGPAAPSNPGPEDDFVIIDNRVEEAPVQPEPKPDDDITILPLDGDEAFPLPPAVPPAIRTVTVPQAPAAETTPEAADDGFSVVDLRGGGDPEAAPEKIGIGGVLAGDGTVDEDGMRVIKSSHADAELTDEEIEARLYDPTLELKNYQRPPVELLEDHSVDVHVSEDEIYENKNQIVRTLENFGIKIDKIKATIGPTVTLYEIVPAAGVKISKIKNLEDDIALSLKALGIRIIAPMPGKGTIGIEVPNRDKEVVSMYSVVKSARFQESTAELPVVLGKTIQNETFIIDLAKMPHLLVAGATGQGKSVGLNAIITSLLYKKHPAELKFVLVDPKKVELSVYKDLERHFLAKMESEEEAILTDTQKVVYTLNSLVSEMEARYELLRTAHCRKITEYNDKFLQRKLPPPAGHRFLPYIVVIVDEFADLIMTAGKEVEHPITRLAQLARAVGIHLIIATQRPEVKVITGLIKSNFPARIAFRVMSMMDSRTIIDQPGANQLIGRGDMLMSQNSEITRVQCAFVDTPEIERITSFISRQKGYGEPYVLPDYEPEPGSETDVSMGESGAAIKYDPRFAEIARYFVQNPSGCSTSAIQRMFEVGFNRAGRIMMQLEKSGIVGRQDGVKPREVLIYDLSTLETKLMDMGL